MHLWVLISRYPGRQESETIMNKNDLKTKLYIHSTIGDVSLMNIWRKTKCFHDFVQCPQQKFFSFPQPRHVLGMFLNFGHFSASCSYKKILL